MMTSTKEKGGNGRLRGKVAIITGGARGIGAATAKLFAQHGANVIIADILDNAGRSTAMEIGAHYVHCDVSRESDVEAVVDVALTCHGQLDIMINNAGMAGPSEGIATLSMEKLKDLLDVNVLGMVHGVKHAARAMVGTKSTGSIICTASSAAILGGLAAHAYSLSKAAVLGLVKSTSCELGRQGIRVNCISPHGVPSEMLVDAFRSALGDPNVGIKNVRRTVSESGCVLAGRGATMEDVAHATLFLASDDAAFITGHNLVVDGGFTSAYGKLKSIYQ